MDDLTPVASNDERAEARCHSTDSEAAFDASAGTTYWIASVWYAWTPAASGQAVISTCVFFTGYLDSLLAVYTGAAVDELAPVASSDEGADGCGPWTDSEVSFDAVAGTTYRIAIDGKGGSEGDFKLLLQGPAESGDEGEEPEGGDEGEEPGSGEGQGVAGPPATSLPSPTPPNALLPQPKPLKLKKTRAHGRTRCVKRKQGKRRR